ncbi:hypothetical protein [Devosia chinhatensis]|uniref:hypothetical protein n=1 Tax=Devosia chinhatensis TaxID=429727 RepID=UPI00128BB5F1|nr:hypothetical protein [Devosia chinhatensis]
MKRFFAAILGVVLAVSGAARRVKLEIGCRICSIPARLWQSAATMRIAAPSFMQMPASVSA